MNDKSIPKRRRVIAVVLLAILAALCVYFSQARSRMNETLLQEKVIARRDEINLVCDMVDRFVERDNDWGQYDYEKTMSDAMSQIDSTGGSGTYAELFDSDLSGVSDRSFRFEGVRFNPLDYPGVIETVLSNEHGEFEIRFDGLGAPAHTLHMYFRWVPTDKSLEGRLLVMVGVSKFSVDTTISAWITYGVIILIIVYAIFALNYIFRQLGHKRPYEGGADTCLKSMSS